MLFKRRPKLSILVNAYNMRRELPRTLFSLQASFQHSISECDYEVLVIENDSSEPVSAEYVRGFGKQFRYFFIESGSPSPCKALNQIASQAVGDWLMCCIDGARILSPGILYWTLKATSLFNHPYIYTLGMHLGAKPQNLAIAEGYNQLVEDQLLESVAWRENGYRLFDISCSALSCRNGYFSELSESNCFTLKKEDFFALGGFDERFQSAGGGLVNLDFFNLAHEGDGYTPVLLLGEASFHQYHGGVATNVPMKEHPWESMAAEYQRVRGKPFVSAYREPVYLGNYRDIQHSS